MLRLKERLQNSDLLFVIWAGVASFLAYFSMYMYRKPYTAGTYTDLEAFGLDYKMVLVISQVLGYAISKLVGIKLIAELDNTKRIAFFSLLIGVAWLALVGFAFGPTSWGFFFLFINGLPLGLIWGIVFSYCEGRRFTEILTVVLSANFIVSSGVAKSLGRWLLGLGVSEPMMPMLMGVVTFPLLGISLWMLHQIPPPAAADKALRSERAPMNRQAKQAFLRQYGLPMFLFVAVYLVLTIIRDLRDNFAVEIWADLGYGESPAIFTTTEIPVALFILVSLGALYLIKQNRTALLVNIAIAFIGMALLFLLTILHQSGAISAIAYMILTGVGLFLPYILLNGIIFDRFIAYYKIKGNVGFIMYIADALGYLGSIAILFYKNFGDSQLEWLVFYQKISWFGGVLGLVLFAALFLFFYTHKNAAPTS